MKKGGEESGDHVDDDGMGRHHLGEGKIRYRIRNQTGSGEGCLNEKGERRGVSRKGGQGKGWHQNSSERWRTQPIGVPSVAHNVGREGIDTSEECAVLPYYRNVAFVRERKGARKGKFLRGGRQEEVARQWTEG